MDRDRGSERVDTLIRFLLKDGWAVTFLADEETPDERHAHRLRQLGSGDVRRLLDTQLA